MNSDDSRGSTELIARQPGEYIVQRFCLEVVAGPDAGQRVTSERDELLVGTSVGNDLVLRDPTVSRQHLMITAMPRGFVLSDLGSSNGTTLGGFRVERAFLKAGATIGVGHSSLRFETDTECLRSPLAAGDRFGRMLGQSSALRRIFALVPKLACSDATILIEGETGCGKSLLAEAIHGESARCGRPFVVVDCGAIAPTLIESELFGHERGAFTGAVSSRLGAFEAAQGGTLLLDEIGELPLDLQPKLLRALEDKVIKRVGGRDSIRLDLRVMAATNRDLKMEVNRGSFRADLFYRLHVISIRIPALRERPEDVGLYMQHFFEQMAKPGDAPPSAELIAAFTRRSWPGNVRELRGAMERALLIGDDQAEPTTAASPPAPHGATLEQDFAGSFRSAKDRAVSAWEREYLTELIRRNEYNLSRAARSARMDRTHLRELLRKYRVAAEGE